MAAQYRTHQARHAALGLLATVAVVAAGCDYIGDPLTVAHVSLSATTITMRVGEATQLRATPYGRDGRALPDVPLGWISSAPDVARVNVRTGQVDALVPGQATVSAVARGKTAGVAVTVIAAP